MNPIFKNFYTQSYLSTGFTPALPSNEMFLPGDFFQIENGRFKLLGNIFRSQLIKPKDIVLEYDIAQSDDDWKMSHGVTEPFFGKNRIESSYETEERSIKRFRFESSGSFFFNALKPRSMRIKNWYDIQDQLTIKLTQTQYSFRNIYVAWETVYLEGWVFALANDKDAELEITIELRDTGAIDFFGETSSKVVLAKNIEQYSRQSNHGLPFFKAKKLSARLERDTLASANAIHYENTLIDWTRDVYDFDFDAVEKKRDDRYSRISLLDSLRGGQLNPNTALEYFRWTDCSLDDIQTLFPGAND